MWTDEQIAKAVDGCYNITALNPDKVSEIMCRMRDDLAAELERLRTENRALRLIIAGELTWYDSQIDDALADLTSDTEEE